MLVLNYTTAVPIPLGTSLLTMQADDADVQVKDWVLLNFKNDDRCNETCRFIGLVIEQIMQ